MANTTDAAAPIMDPIADSQAIVSSGNARFTVLTDQLIRLEWAEDGEFINNASLVFINRKLEPPQFQTKNSDGWLTIQTKKLRLHYREDSGRFNSKNLSIELELNGSSRMWHPGLKDSANLFGTMRTLDRVKGAAKLEPGLLSRDGWVLVDDSKRPLFDNSDWQWSTPAPEKDYQDWYFFGHGHDYKAALYDFTLVAGKIPLPPRFAFGLWWSRYWAYTDQELKQLVYEFEIHNTPLDVLVIDMDWHETFKLRWWKKQYDQAGQRIGWTGYSWNKILFPDPPEFLNWCHQKGLKTSLNLHPASGVQPHEAKYPEMARAMGVDPATQKYIPFDIVDKKFAQNYFKILHHPLERQGVDFWWLDWQQQPITKIDGVNPTFWLNYLHFTDMERRGKRPLIFHRWGGLGNHRYQIGFSGDAISVWESLAFQPYFTTTASNVGYGYWSHDIGGHIPGILEPELYNRWIQFGLFSPILRTHTTRNIKAERRIWAYPVDYFLIMRDAILLRYALIPYIYTAARQAYDLGVSICRPMYYNYQEEEQAYQFKDQYMFGDDLLVAPITEPTDSVSLLAEKKIWLPPGTWIEWFSGNILQGPATIKRNFANDEIPVYARAGAIIPMQPKMRYSNKKPLDPLILTIFPGDSGQTRVYEDQGNTVAYKNGQFSWTPIQFHKTDERLLNIEILPVEGSFPEMLTERAYEIRLPLVFPPEKITCQGEIINFKREENRTGWRYDGDKVSLIIRLPRFETDTKVTLQVEFSEKYTDKLQLLQGVPGKISKFKRVMPLLNSLWPKEWSPDILIEAAQTGVRIELQPETIIDELTKLQQNTPEIIRQIERLNKINRKIVNQALAHLAFLER